MKITRAIEINRTRSAYQLAARSAVRAYNRACDRSGVTTFDFNTLCYVRPTLAKFLLCTAGNMATTEGRNSGTKINAGYAPFFSALLRIFCQAKRS